MSTVAQVPENKIFFTLPVPCGVILFCTLQYISHHASYVELDNEVALSYASFCHMYSAVYTGETAIPEEGSDIVSRVPDN